jgi:hypothetical protein
MLFERQRLLLALLDAMAEPVAHTDFQKLLFLFTQEWEAAPSYDFVPYKFGCFSFTSYPLRASARAGYRVRGPARAENPG